MRRIVVLNDGETWSPVEGATVYEVTEKMWKELEEGADISSFTGLEGDLIEALISETEELHELRKLQLTLVRALGADAVASIMKALRERTED